MKYFLVLISLFTVAILAQRSGGRQRAIPSDATEFSQGCSGPNTACVPYYRCKGETLTDSSGVIDIAIDEHDPPCGYLEVCCASTDLVSDSVRDTLPRISSGCGYRNINGIGFRISGERDNETQFGEFPWMSAVLEKRQMPEGVFNYYLCGGSLIHPSVILTAAHCIADQPNNVLKVRLGEWDTQTKNEPLPYQDRDVVEVHIHEAYRKGALHNDIALLFLESPATITENVQTVCLPSINENFEYQRCFATGWGKDRFGAEGKYQVILKKIDLPIIRQEECQRMLQSTKLSQYFELHDSFMCAGGEPGKDTCKGDGGSPLVCPIAGTTNQYYQAGIVAWGIGCGKSNVPGVYAKVPKFRDWIDQMLRRKGIDQSSYTP